MVLVDNSSPPPLLHRVRRASNSLLCKVEHTQSLKRTATPTIPIGRTQAACRDSWTDFAWYVLRSPSIQPRYTWMTAASSTSPKEEASRFVTTMLAPMEASTATHIHAIAFFPRQLCFILVFNVNCSFWLLLRHKSSPTPVFVRCHRSIWPKCFQQLRYWIVRIQRGGVWR